MEYLFNETLFYTVPYTLTVTPITRRGDADHWACCVVVAGMHEGVDLPFGILLLF
jgi:hypothetical protein